MKKGTTLLKQLIHILTAEGKQQHLYACMEDLAANGLDPTRFAATESKPRRQDLAQHVISYLCEIGIPENNCRQWAIDYCTDMLSKISSTSLSQIKHSAKSTIKYIYGAKVPFDCGCQNNPFKAACDPNCPVYSEMEQRYQARLQQDALRLSGVVEKQAPPEKDLEYLSKKQQYKERFEAAQALMKDCMLKEMKSKTILALLNEQGLITRTGKSWTLSILSREMKLLVEENPELMNV
jgi:hypothetical protein